MKKLILITALAVTICGSSAYAYESRYNNYRVGYVDPRSSLDRHINHLNRMVEHVRWEVRHYRADWRIRRDVNVISNEVDRVNYRYRHGSYNGWRLRRDVDRLHDQLHAIEQRLHVRSRDYYRWD